MWRPIATIAAAARDVELEDPVLKLSGYSIYVNLVLNIFIFLGGGPTLNTGRLKPATGLSWDNFRLFFVIGTNTLIYKI